MSSYHNVNITSSVEQLTKAIGEPTVWAPECTDDKVQAEFEYQLPCGETVYIYAWKEYREINKFEILEFHIGSSTLSKSIEAQVSIDYLLNNLD